MVRLTLTTHDKVGATHLDVDLAKKINTRSAQPSRWSRDQAPGPRNARTRANAAYATSSSYPETNFLFSFVLEKIVVAVISRTKRTATISVRNPMIRARLPKNSSNVNRSANTAPPGHPVPFTKPIGFFTSLIFGQPWTRNKAPPAPQQNPRSRHSRISTTRTPGIRYKTSRGSLYTSL